VQNRPGGVQASAPSPDERGAVSLFFSADQEVGKPDVKSTPSPDAPSLVLASEILQRLHDEAPKDHFTLGWLMGTLHTRSFGIIMLLCAVVAVAPGISIVSGLLLMITAVQMIEGHPAPVFPAGIAARPLPARHLATVLQRSLPVLRYLERVAHPRWPTPHQPTKRVVGIVVLILGIALVFTPLPLSNIPPALAIALISLAYLEEDGLLLAVGLLVAVIVVTIQGFAVWEMVAGAKRLIGL
jgi:hypothetical protein